MSKLDEIEARHITLHITGDNVEWLIARVRTLETALTETHNKLDRLNELAMTAPARRHANIIIADNMRVALKEK